MEARPRATIWWQAGGCLRERPRLAPSQRSLLAFYTLPYLDDSDRNYRTIVITNYFQYPNFALRQL
jgi:hypothetical protein